MAIEIKPIQTTPATETPSKGVPPTHNTDIKKVDPVTPEISISELNKPQNQDLSAKSLNEKDLDAIVSKLNDFVEQQKRDIRFSVDKDTNKTIVRLLDGNGDVLKQIPSEEVLAILKGIESNKGLFFTDEA